MRVNSFLTYSSNTVFCPFSPIKASIEQIGLTTGQFNDVTLGNFLLKINANEGMPRVSSFYLDAMWSFDAQFVIRFEAEQLFLYLSDAGFNNMLIYQIKLRYLSQWTTQNVDARSLSMTEYAVRMRSFVEQSLPALLPAIPTTGGAYSIKSFEMKIYAGASASAIQRMFYFNFYRNENAEILLSWFTEWKSFGYSFDLVKYTNWRITIGQIVSAPLNIYQRYFMSYVESISSSINIDIQIIEIIRNYVLEMNLDSETTVQQFFRGNDGFSKILRDNPGSIDGISRFIKETYSASFSSVLTVYEILTRFQSRVQFKIVAGGETKYIFTEREFQKINLQSIQWTMIRSDFTESKWLSVIQGSGALAEIQTDLSQNVDFGLLSKSISVDLLPAKLSLYGLYSVQFSWMEENYIFDTVKEVVREVPDVVLSGATEINLGFVYKLRAVYDAIEISANFGTLSKSEFFVKYVSSLKIYVLTSYTQNGNIDMDAFFKIDAARLSLTADLASFGINVENSLNLFGQHQIGFAKFFFTFMIRISQIRSEQLNGGLQNLQDDSMVDFGLFIYFLGGYDYSIRNDGISFEAYLSAYVRSFIEKVEAENFSDDVYIGFLTQFKSVIYDADFSSFAAQQTMTASIFRAGGNFKNFFSNIQGVAYNFYSAEFYSSYSIGSSDVYTVNDDTGVSTVATNNYRRMYTSSFSAVNWESFDWNILFWRPSFFSIQQWPLAMSLRNFLLMYVGMTEVDSNSLIQACFQSGEFDAKVSQTKYDVPVIDVILQNAGALDAKYSLTTILNSFDFYQFSGTFELYRYVINESNAFRYYINFGRFISTFDLFTAYESGTDITQNLVTSFFRTSRFGIRYNLSWLPSRITGTTATDFNFVKTYSNVIYNTYTDVGACSVTCGLGKSTQTRSCRIPAVLSKFGCSGLAEVIFTCKEEDCPQEYDATILTAVIRITIVIEVPITATSISASVFSSTSIAIFDPENIEMALLFGQLMGSGSSFTSGLTNTLLQSQNNGLTERDNGYRSALSFGINSFNAVRRRPARRRRSLSRAEMRGLKVG